VSRYLASIKQATFRERINTRANGDSPPEAMSISKRREEAQFHLAFCGSRLIRLVELSDKPNHTIPSGQKTIRKVMDINPTISDFRHVAERKSMASSAFVGSMS